MDALDTLLKGKLDRKKLNLPRNIETRANTKEIFKEALRLAGAGRTRNRFYKQDAIAEQMGDLIDLNKLAPLPSYKRFVEDLESALRQIGYIR